MRKKKQISRQKDNIKQEYISLRKDDIMPRLKVSKLLN